MRRKQLFAIALAGSLTMGMGAPGYVTAEDLELVSEEPGPSDDGDIVVEETTYSEEQEQNDFATFGDEDTFENYDEGSGEGDTSDDFTYTDTTYEEPVYEDTVYEEPVYEEPVYEEPVYEEPVYEEPSQEEPSQDQQTETSQETENTDGESGTSVVMTEDQLRGAIANASSNGQFTPIVIGSDITLSSTVTIPAGKNITLISGIDQCMIDRSDFFTGAMFQVEGSLIFEKGSTPGTAGQFLLNGALSGLSAEGSVINVTTGGSFGMDRSLKITGNSSSGKGSAIKNVGGIVYLLGGTITGNSASEGGAVYSDGYVVVGDDIYIQGNTASDGVTSNNVALTGSQAYLVVDSSFEEEAKIGLHSADEGTSAADLVVLSTNAESNGVTQSDVLPHIVLESEPEEDTDEEESEEENTDEESSEESSDEEGSEEENTDEEDASLDSEGEDAAAEENTEGDNTAENVQDELSGDLLGDGAEDAGTEDSGEDNSEEKASDETDTPEDEKKEDGTSETETDTDETEKEGSEDENAGSKDDAEEKKEDEEGEDEFSGEASDVLLQEIADVAWTSHTEAANEYRVNKAGKYCAAWGKKGGTAPTFDFDKDGIAVEANKGFEVTVSGITDETGDDLVLYVQVKSEEGDLSNLITTELVMADRPAAAAPEVTVKEGTPAWVDHDNATVTYTSNRDGLLCVAILTADQPEPEFTFGKDAFLVTADEEIEIPADGFTDEETDYVYYAQVKTEDGEVSEMVKSTLRQSKRPLKLSLKEETVGNPRWTSCDTAVVKYISSKDGTLNYVVATDASSGVSFASPTGSVKVKAGETAKIVLSEFENKDTDYTIYAQVTDADGVLSNTVEATLEQTKRPPSLEKVSGPKWTSHNSAVVNCISDKDGFYYVHVAKLNSKGEPKDYDFTDELKNKGTEIKANEEFEINLEILDESKSDYRVFVLVKDKDGNLSKKRTDIIKNEKRPAKERDKIVYKVEDSTVTGLEKPLKLKAKVYYPFDVVGAGSTDETIKKKPVVGDIYWTYSYWMMEGSTAKHEATSVGSATDYNRESTIPISIHFDKYEYTATGWKKTEDAGSKIVNLKTATWQDERDPHVHDFSETTITGLDSTYQFKPGVKQEFSVTGAGMDDTALTNPVAGDVRWQYIGWTWSIDNYAETFGPENNAISFTDGYNSDKGFTMKFYVRKQMYTGSGWTDGEYKEITKNVKTATYNEDPTRDPKVYAITDTTVTGLDGTYTFKPGVTQAFQVTNQGQTDTDLTNSPVAGDVRWVYRYWTSSVDDYKEQHANSTLAFTDGYNSSEGMTVRLYLQKQTFSGTEWVNGDLGYVTKAVKTSAYQKQRDPIVHKVTESTVSGLENALELRPNVFYDFTVTGAGTDDPTLNSSPVAGDVRWIPRYWIMEGGSSRQETWKIGAPNGINDNRTIPIRIYLMKQTYNGSEWVPASNTELARLPAGSLEYITYEIRTKSYSTTTVTPVITRGGSSTTSSTTSGTNPTSVATNPYLRNLTLTPVISGVNRGVTTGTTTADGARTGDDSPIGVLSLLMIASLLSGGYVIVRRRKRS